MRPASSTPDPARLLAEAGWLRALALRLVGDREIAEDVAQETLLAAIERRGQWKSESGLRAWLAAVTRNLARRSYRRELARTGAEREAARSEELASASAAAARVELHRVLVDAVLALEEPYRSAVIWRHLDGLSAEEIASRQGCSAEAARTRVARALAKLRERLDRSFEGGRASWCALLAARLDLPALLPTAGAAASKPLLIGGLAMAGKSVWIGATAIALAAIVWVAQRQSSELGPAEQEPLAATPHESARGIHGGRTAEESVEGGTEGALPDAGSQRAPLQADERSSFGGEGELRFHGVVRDREGRAIEGVRMRIEGPVALDPVPGELRTQSDGSFAWELAPGAPASADPRDLELFAEHEAYVTAHAPIEPGVACAIVLHAFPKVRGRLLDTDGSPAAGPGMVWLEIEAAEGGEKVERDARTEPDGTFVVTALPLGRLSGVRGRARGFAESRRALDLALELDGIHELDLRLDPGLIVRGSVVDARSREAIPDAIVFADRFQYADDGIEPVTIADDRGRFELHGVEAGPLLESDVAPDVRFAVLEIDARAEGYVSSPLRRSATAASAVEAGLVEGVEIALERAGCSVAGRVLESGGAEPARGQLLLIVDAHSNPHSAMTDAEGRFRVEGLPEGSCSILATPTLGQNPRRAASRELELVIGREEEVEIELAIPDCAVSGRVVDAAGQPVPGAIVSVEGRFACKSVTIAYQNLSCPTDENGHFWMGVVFPGSCVVKVSAPEGSAPLGFEPESHELLLESGETREDVEFRAWPAMQISGRVAEADGSACAYDLQLRDPQSGGKRYRMDSSPDGTFAFRGVRPDLYVLLVQRNGREVARETVGPAHAIDLVLQARE